MGFGGECVRELHCVCVLLYYCHNVPMYADMLILPDIEGQFISLT